MSSNNNNPRKKQKKTEAVVADEDSSVDSLSVSNNAEVVQALAFGNILKKFPDLLICVLPYIADRIVWNSIASSNRDTYKK